MPMWVYPPIMLGGSAYYFNTIIKIDKQLASFHDVSTALTSPQFLLSHFTSISYLSYD